MSHSALSYATIGSGLIAFGATVASPAVDPVPFLKAILWTVVINGQTVGFTGQSLIAITSCAVGVFGLVLGVVRLIRGK